ncbi:MAG: DUF5723 family protein, partial [Capnocytophaga sp.]|nr:DUF5723 family protein [Capnocytophaga sp.]
MKKFIITFVLAISVGSVLAQELRSSYFMETSMFRHQMNPAFIDSQYIAVPFLGNINIRTSGKNGTSTFLYPLENDPDYDKTTFMNPEVDSHTFLKKIKNRVNFDINLNYNVLSGVFRAFGGANLVELNIRSNTYATLPHSFFVFMKAPQTKQQYDFDKLGLRSETYAELVFGHSRKLNREVTVGGKFKFLVGGSYAQYKVNHLTATQNGNQWVIEGDTELEAAIFNSQFKYNDNQVRGLTRPTFGLPGFGAAVDLGIVYKASSFIDGLTLSASVTDLGYIAWKDVNTAASQGTWSFSGFRNLPVYESDSGVNIKDQARAMKSEV